MKQSVSELDTNPLLPLKAEGKGSRTDGYRRVARTRRPEYPKYLGQAGEELAHAAGALVDILLRHRVGDADVLGSSEGLARNGDDVRFVQEAGRHFGGGADAALAQERAD